MTALDSRDVTKDVPCDGCGRPIWRMYPHGSEELAYSHTIKQDAERCPLTRRLGKWPVPRDPREHTESDKWCRHPSCKDTNWGGKDRMHLRTPPEPGCSTACPPYDPNPIRSVSEETRAFLYAYVLKLRGES